MAKAAKQSVGLKRQVRRVAPGLRRGAQRAQAAAQQATLTLGELIAAAYDTVGGEAREVVKLVTSRPMTRALGRRIVFVS